MKMEISFSPRLMKAPHAAQYLGISASKLRTLPIAPKLDGGNTLYDRLDLDAYADSLPYGGDGAAEGGEKCEADEVFG